MYPVRALSINNAWSKLLLEHPQEWQEIQMALSEISLDTLEDEKYKPDYRKTSEKSLYDLPKIWDDHIVNYDWVDIRGKQDNGTPINFIASNVKNKVSSNLIVTELTRAQELTRYLFVNSPRASKLGICDMFIILVPTDNITSLYGHDDFVSIINESVCRKQIKDFVELYTKHPFLIIFFSDNYEEILIEDISKPKENNNTIERSLEFAPEYTQAGISVLSYFSEVLRQKYPDLNVKVRIEQQGTSVLMHVELPSGHIDTIKEELATYFLIVAGKEKPEALLSSPYHVIALETKLQIANMELRMAHQLNTQLNRDIEGVKVSQQRMEETFKMQIGEQGEQIKALINLAAQQGASHERLQLAQIGHASKLFKDLLSEAHGNQAVLGAIRSLEHNLMSGIALIDVQDQLSASLATIQQEKPSLLRHLAGQVESAGFGAAGSFVLDWIIKHS